MGKPLDPDYWKKYRRDHPAYRARSARQHAARRRLVGRGDRSAEYARDRRSRALAGPSLIDLPLPPLHVGHEILERAVTIARRYVRPDGRVALGESIYDDVVGETALAIVEGRDPDEAALELRRSERRWQRETMPFLIDGFDGADDPL